MRLSEIIKASYPCKTKHEFINYLVEHNVDPSLVGNTTGPFADSGKIDGKEAKTLMGNDPVTRRSWKS